MAAHGLRRLAALFAAFMAMMSVLTACASNDETDGSTPAAESNQRWPDVIDVEVRRAANAYDFDVTISSPYDSPERYADGWRIRDADGNVYGEHDLLHDHASEQPFTRTQTGVDIPEGVAEVIVEGRDSEFGYGGESATVALP